LDPLWRVKGMVSEVEVLTKSAAREWGGALHGGNDINP
jgi:hypothetical protein